MRSRKRCLLSVAMIMKNEEHNLDRALGSIKPYVDEIIVVDTGSTDNSVEIVKKYTDKIYFHEWKDDFSEARNYSLQFPTCEWVLIYDADEEVKEDFAGIREFLEKLPDDVNTVYLPTLSYLDWDLKKTELASTPRLFRNGTVRYENIVHNQAIYKGRVVEAPFTIYHYGYIWTRKLRKKKYERTRNLLVKLLQEKSDMSVNERIYYLCQLYKTEVIGGNKIEAYKIVGEILRLVENSKGIPAIALEVIFLHSLDLINKGFEEEALNLLESLTKSAPNNPDPYYGLLLIQELKKDYDKAIEYGEEFFRKIEYVEQKPHEFPWTIITIKYKSVAHSILANAYLKKGDIDNFRRHFKSVFETKVLTANETAKLSLGLLSAILELEDEKFKELLNEVMVLLNLIRELGQNVNVLDIVERIVRLNIKFDIESLRPFLVGRFGELLIQKLKNGKDGLIEYIFGSDLNEWVSKVEKMGTEALLFLYENVPDDDPSKLKLLSKLKLSENNVLKGISHGLIGDVHLQRANYKLALDYYKKAAEILPELSRFIKPILDDLKTRLDPTIDGIFKELKDFYLSSKEMMVESLGDFPKHELMKLYLISESDYAKYISAVNIWNSKKERALELLDSIRNWENFPFIEYRYAKLLEDSDDQEDLEKSYHYHFKALKKTVALGDISLGVFKFDNFYPFENFGNANDEIAWVGNISEKHSGLGVISPLRVWRKTDRYYYVEPFHVDEAIRIYKERLKNHKLAVLEPKKEEVLKVLSELDVDSIRVLEEDERYEKLVKNSSVELGIEYSQDSRNFVSFEFVNTAKDFKDIVEKFQSGALFYFVPDFGNRDDIVWYYPLFRFIRTRKQIEEELKKYGARRIKHYVLNNSLKAVVFEK